MIDRIVVCKPFVLSVNEISNVIEGVLKEVARKFEDIESNISYVGSVG